MFYPLATSGSMSPLSRRTRFERTGEHRPPKAREHFLSGAIPEVYRAPGDLPTSYDIMRPVETRIVEVRA